MEMPYLRLYPPDEAIVLDGGLDTKFEKALIPDNESPDCLNVEFVNGICQTRQGATRLNTNAAGGGGNAFDGLYSLRLKDGVTEYMLGFINGSTYQLGATTFNTIASAQSVWTIGSRVGADTAEGYLFMCNGANGPYKYDGTYWTQAGVFAPVQTATVSTGTTGSLTTSGTYQYVYTNVNSALVESNISPPTATFTVGTSGLAAIISNIASGATASMGVSQRWLYRTKANVPGAYFRVTKLNDVSTTSFTDTVSDTNLGVQAPTDNGTPPTFNAICYVNNILFMNDVNNPNFVWYSDIGQPYTVASTNFFKVGDHTSDLVKGFARFDNSLVIFCEQSTWINFMPSPATPSGWQQIRTDSPYGSKSPYCLMQCSERGQNGVLHPAFLNRKFVGIGFLQGTSLVPNTTDLTVVNAGSDLQSTVIEPDMFSVQDGFALQFSGIVFKNRAFVSLTYGSGATTNNRIYVWDFSYSNLKKEQFATWVPWTGTPYSVNQMCVYGGNLYGASSGTSGYVYQIAYTNVYNDDGSAINSYLTTKEFPGYPEDIQYTKDFRYLNFLYDNAGNYYMNVTYKTDSDTGSGTSVQVNLTSGGNDWESDGTGLIWGSTGSNGTWGGGVSQTESRIYFGSALRGKRLTLKFSNQNAVNQRFAVHRLQFRYNVKGYR